jgi:hypothetical protein
MSAAQMKTLAEWVRSRTTDDDLLEAADDLESGNLDAKKIAAGYKSVAPKGFDAVSYRETLAPPAVKRAEIDESLVDVLGDTGKPSEAALRLGGVDPNPENPGQTRSDPDVDDVPLDQRGPDGARLKGKK